MRVPFTKMQGAGNDFVVLDRVRHPQVLTDGQLRQLGDRRFGVGADQILIVEPSNKPGIDFRYRIVNGADGSEVEHCGNGARCFARYVHGTGLTDKTTIRVETVNQVLELRLQADGRVTVDMSQPVFEHARIPFEGTGLQPRREGGFELWPLPAIEMAGIEMAGIEMAGTEVPGIEVAVLSMGNPHAVLRVADVDAAPVAELGPLIEAHPRFPRRVNVGFMQVVSRREVRLRVHERSAGETLACGTGACAAVVAGIRLGWLDARVEVHARGGDLLIEWAGGPAPVLMTGPAITVFQGEIEL